MAYRYCDCGREIFVDFRAAESVPRMHQMDGARAREKSHCDGCGERLRYLELRDSTRRAPGLVPGK